VCNLKYIHTSRAQISYPTCTIYRRSRSRFIAQIIRMKFISGRLSRIRPRFRSRAGLSAGFRARSRRPPITLPSPRVGYAVESTHGRLWNYFKASCVIARTQYLALPRRVHRASASNESVRRRRRRRRQQRRRRRRRRRRLDTTTSTPGSASSSLICPLVLVLMLLVKRLKSFLARIRPSAVRRGERKVHSRR